MKKSLLFLFIFSLFLNVNNANALNIAIIETEEIIEKSTAMKKAKEKILKQRSIYQDELSREEENLKRELEKLEKQRSKFTKEALNKKEKKLSEDIAELNQLLQKRNEILQKTEIEIITKIGNKIEEILQDIKKKENFDIILSSKQVVLYNKNMDISKKVLVRLNKELPKVKVRF